MESFLSSLETQDGLTRVLGAIHRRWANFVNARGRWRGHLFDGRFASVAMDQAHLLAAVRHVAMNPVRAHLVARAQGWRWSSVRAHLVGADDGLVTADPQSRIDDFTGLVEGDADVSVDDASRKAELTGRPVGTAAFIADLERRLGRPIARRAPGRTPAQPSTEHPSLP
jgi:putative transposase